MSLCDDISEFLDILKKMRITDDKIVYALNTSIPTESFHNKVDVTATCRDLFSKLSQSHTERDTSLNQCLKSTVNKVHQLKEQRNAAPNDITILINLRREQMKLRELETQLNVEEVIKRRSLKIYNERCRSYYKPGDTALSENVANSS